MNLLLAWLLIPFSFADHTFDCERSSELFQIYEHKLDNSRVGAMNEDGSVSPLCKEQVIIDEAKLDSKANEFLKIHGCDSLAHVDLQMAALENEQAMLVGIKKLHHEIKTHKERTKNKELTEAMDSGKKFVSALNVAAEIESFLVNDGALLMKINKAKITPLDEKNFPEKIRPLCEGIKEGPCDPSYKPNKETLSALNEMTKSDLSNEAVNKFVKAFKIKKTSDGSDYSFAQMQADLEANIDDMANGKISLNQEQLKNIQALPDFSSVGISQLQHLRKKPGAFETFHQFKFHLEDLRARQLFESRTKIAAIAEILPSESCNSADFDYHCIEVYEKLQNSVTDGALKGNIDEVITGLKVSKSFDQKLEKLGYDCFTASAKDKNQYEFSESCNDVFSKNDDRLAEISSQFSALAAIKERIGNQAHAQNLIQVRNFLLSQLKDNACLSSQPHSLDNCELTGDLSKIKTVEYLQSDIKNIFAKASPQVKEIDVLCDGEKTFPHKKEICFQEKPKVAPLKVNKEAVKKSEAYEGPTKAPIREDTSQRDALVQGIGMAAQHIAGAYAQSLQRPPVWTPPVYNYAPPYSGHAPMYTISDRLLQQGLYYQSQKLWQPNRGAFAAVYAPYNSSRARSSYFFGR